MATIAEHSIKKDSGFERHRATIMDARNGPETYWFIFDTADGLEAVIPFDWVEFKHYTGAGGTDPEKISTIEFYRTTPGRMTRKVKAGQVEGGRADWSDDIIDALEDIRDGGV